MSRKINLSVQYTNGRRSNLYTYFDFHDKDVRLGSIQQNRITKECLIALSEFMSKGKRYKHLRLEILGEGTEIDRWYTSKCGTALIVDELELLKNSKFYNPPDMAMLDEFFNKNKTKKLWYDKAITPKYQIAKLGEIQSWKYKDGYLGITTQYNEVFSINLNTCSFETRYNVIITKDILFKLR